MPVFYDQLNRAITLQSPPQRIVSIVPSKTELLFYLGLDAQIVGVTKFCIHPADKVKHIAKIGGTKQLNIAAIHQLKPDLIIANKEENEKAQVEDLMQHYPVWISDIDNLQSSLNMITGVGEITARAKQAEQLTAVISEQFSKLGPTTTPLRVAYLIWRKPYMVAGRDTFINSMLQLCGFQNVFYSKRYPEVSIEELISARPDVVLLSSEPYPFSDKHIDEFKSLLPLARIELVDGEMFSWYGSRLLHAPAYFTTLINKLTAI